MPHFQLQQEQRDLWLRVSISGVWSPDTAPRILTEILTTLATNPQERLLVDVRGVQDLTDPEDNAVVGDALGEMFAGKLRKAAVVDVESNRANNDMLEATARRQGINARWFYDLEAAERWLQI